MLHRRLPTFVAALALAPLSGCALDTADTDTFHFGAADMEALATGDFTGTLTRPAKKATALTLHLDHVVKTSQPACGSRELYHAECIDLSDLGVAGTLTTADKTLDAAKVTGGFQVYGLDLSQGQLSFTTPASETFTIAYANQAFQDGQVLGAKGEAAGSFTLAKP